MTEMVKSSGVGSGVGVGVGVGVGSGVAATGTCVAETAGAEIPVPVGACAVPAADSVTADWVESATEVCGCCARRITTPASRMERRIRKST